MLKNKIARELRLLANPEKARGLTRFFKTAPGEYGAGDVFLGIMVPEQRIVAKNNATATLAELQSLLNSKIHEFRLTALLVLVEQAETGSKKIVDFYLKNSNNVNNWDLVDLSAPRILGQYLLERDRKILYKLARSKNLWQKRIAIISTLTFIKQHQFADTIKLAEILLNDEHDLIQKAVGWMLREVGKKDLKTKLAFLQKFAALMPRTMLRYAIERLPENQRQKFLQQK